MGKQLKGRSGTNPGKVTLPQKKTSGLNWVLKTPILKQRAAMGSSKQPSSLQQVFSSPMTMSNRTVAETTENPKMPENSAEANPSSYEQGLIEGNKKKIRRNETFSIKKFPPNQNQPGQDEALPDATILAKKLATTATVTGHGQSNIFGKHSDSFSDDEASDKNDAVERDLRSLRSQLEQAVSTVENALTSYKEWKRLHSIHE